MKRDLRLLLPGAAFACVALLWSLPASAQSITIPDIGTLFGDSVTTLLILFVLAILIESALSVIFNWRLFLQLFNGRGVKTLVMIAVSALVVFTFHIDVLEKFLAKNGYGGGGPVLSGWITALILAGGSAGVYKILVALGYREEKPAAEIKPKPPRNKAWFSVRIVRRQAVGPVYVTSKLVGPVSATSPPPLAGAITTEGFWRTLWSVFFLDRSRFPQAGGYEVAPGFEYAIAVVGMDSAGQVVPSPIDGKYTFTDGAIIDFTVTL